MTTRLENEAHQELYYRGVGESGWSPLILEVTKILADQVWELSLDQAEVLARVFSFGRGDGGWVTGEHIAETFPVWAGERRRILPADKLFVAGE